MCTLTQRWQYFSSFEKWHSVGLPWEHVCWLLLAYWRSITWPISSLMSVCSTNWENVVIVIAVNDSQRPFNRSSGIKILRIFRPNYTVTGRFSRALTSYTIVNINSVTQAEGRRTVWRIRQGDRTVYSCCWLDFGTSSHYKGKTCWQAFHPPETTLLARVPSLLMKLRSSARGEKKAQ